MTDTELIPLRCIDSPEIANAARADLDMSREEAMRLGTSAVEAARCGWYTLRSGERIDWSAAVQAARAAKVSIPPDAALPARDSNPIAQTWVQVANESTLTAAKRLIDDGARPLALNFANGRHPGGNFRDGSRAQEGNLCRSSALFETLVGDEMYEAHQQRPLLDSTDWAILSPDVPVFRTDAGVELESPWLLSFLTCAAPIAQSVGLRESGELLERRIHRVLAIARAYGYESLVLGAWGCGVFGNDPYGTAADFKRALETDFAGAFAEVVFAIVDRSPERKILGPFRDAFAARG